MDNVTSYTEDDTVITTAIAKWIDISTWAQNFTTTDDITSVNDVTNSAFNMNDATTLAQNTTTHLYDTFNYFTHPHWRNFPVPSAEWHYLMGVIITIVGFTGILGNALVIYMFTQDKSLRTSSNMFVINLAISDMTFCIVNGFPLFSLSAFNKRWLFGDAACEFYGLIGGIFGLMSINTMTAISIDRYQAIARPIHVAKTMTRKRAFLMIVVVWLWSLASAMPPIFGWGRYIPEGFQTSCTYDYLTQTYNNKSFMLFMYIFGFAVPLFVIIVSYVMIVMAVNKHEQEMKKTAKKLNAVMRTNQEQRKMDIKVAKIAVSIVLLYLLSWTPYATVALVGQFGDASMVTPFWSEIPVIFAKASAMHNPIVYALSHPKFRAAVHKRIPWLMCFMKKSEIPSAQASAMHRQASRASSHSSISEIEASFTELDMRMRSLEKKIESKVEVQTGGADSSIPSGQVIQDLTKVLVRVVSRDQSPDKYQTTSGGSQGNQDGIFIIDKKSLPQLAKLVADVSQGSPARNEGGVVNKAYDESSESPPETETTHGEKKSGEGDVSL